MSNKLLNAAIPSLDLIALVYRVGKGCKQYPFYDLESLQKWVSRHPYKNEMLNVIPVKGGHFLGSSLIIVRPVEAVEYVKKMRGQHGWCPSCIGIVRLIDGGRNMREVQAGVVVGPESCTVAGHQVLKLLGVKNWFEWNGRKFDLKIVCDIICEPMPEVSEYEKDANYGCTNVAWLFGDVDESWMNSILDRHDVIFNHKLEDQRNGK